MKTDMNDNVLGLDFSSCDLLITAELNGKVYSSSFQEQRSSSEKVWDRLQGVCDAAGCPVKDFSVFALGTGPGYFTGLRISLSILKAFVMASKARIVTVPSYDVYAAALAGKDRICVSFDARKDLYYAACYERRKGRLKKVLKETLLSRQEIVEYGLRGFALCGDSVSVLKASERRRIDCIDPSLWRINPYVFLGLCRGKIKRKQFRRLQDARLLYVHPQTCQVR